jgi:hypothetical protein
VPHRLAPRHITTTEHPGRAMIAVVPRKGEGPRTADSVDINRFGSP